MGGRAAGVRRRGPDVSKPCRPGPACTPETRSQRFLLLALTVGAACAAVLSLVGVGLVAIAALGMVPVPALALVGAVLGLVAWQALR